MDTRSLADRLRYRFDNFMSRGTVALIAGLAVISLAIIVVMAAVVTLTGVSQEGTGRIGLGGPIRPRSWTVSPST